MTRRLIPLVILALFLAAWVSPARVVPAQYGGNFGQQLPGYQSAATFTPASLPPFVWLRADEGNPLTTNGTTAAGTSPPAVTFTGTPSTSTAWAASTTSLEIDITTGGVLGTALFTWKLLGATQATGQNTASTFALGSTGVTANFPAGTYSTNNVYTTEVTGSAWNDQSSNAFSFAQATSSHQWAWNASDSTLGGRPSFTSTAASGYLSTAALPMVQPFTYYAVYHNSIVASGSSEQFLWSVNAGDGTQSFQFYQSNYRVYCNVALQGGTPTTGSHAIAIVVNGASSAVYVDNSSSAVLSGNAGTTSSTGSAFALGSTPFTSLGFLGTIGEEIFASGAASQATRGQVFGYFASRYVLSVSSNDAAPDWRRALLDLPRVDTHPILAGWPSNDVLLSTGTD